MRRVIVLVGLAACASPGLPPGGPPDTDAPRVVDIAPDSGATRVTPSAVVFRFDEVVSERPAGVTNLADLFLISPQNGVADVDWRRDEVSVRPSRGWQRNTVYTVTMLPGIADLRGNISRVGLTTFFSTGAEIPRTAITGRVYDWFAGTTAANALVQATAPDSTVYVTTSDSSGAFTLVRLPPGTYVLRGVIDQNRNRAIDLRESFDTITVTLRDTLAMDLLAFPQDSVPPRLTEATVADSLALRLVFDLAIDPAQTFAPDQFRILTSRDARRIPVRSVSFLPRDTTVRALRRPVPPRGVSLSLAAPLAAAASYTVRAENIRGVAGIVGTSERTFTVPAAARDTSAAPRTP